MDRRCRNVLFAVVVWLTVACPFAPAREALPDAGTDAGFDAGSDAGLDAGIDAGTNARPDASACAAVAADISAEVEMPQTCDAGSDCTFITTPCGLPGVCGAVVNTAAAAAVASLVSQLAPLDCPPAGACLNCPRGPSGAYCQQGLCQATWDAAGQACTTAADCPTIFPPGNALLCLTDGGFTNGDCVQPCTDDWGCVEGGLVCEPLPGAPETPGACFLDCSSDSDCRTSDGYACCPAWGPNANFGSVCYPGPCPT